MVETDKIRNIAKEIVSRDDVKMVIGYAKGTYGLRARPVFITEESEADELIFDATCTNNLASYLVLAEKAPLPRGTEPDSRKTALFVKGCDSKAVVQQLVEKAYKREEVIVIGIPCEGVVDEAKVKARFSETLSGSIELEGDSFKVSLNGKEETVSKNELIADKCLRCLNPNPVISDALISDEVEIGGTDDFEDVEEFAKIKTEDRWRFWEENLSHCIRCYACRNACPLCYCEECILTKILPTWVRRSNDISENSVYHIARAYHLAGRCIGCEECQRVCPMDIPLMKLNRKFSKDVLEMFDYTPGVDMEAEPLLVSFKPNDPEEYIL